MISYHVVKKKKLTAEKISLENCGLKNFYRIGEGVYRSDQPSRKCFRALENFGIREVLNLRFRHNDNDEARDTTLIRLHHIRTRASRVTLDELTEALRIIRDRQGPLLLHCWHGSDRTGAVVAMYRMVFQDIDKENAIDEMVNGIFGFHMMFDNIIETVHQADIFKIRQELFNNPSLS